MAADRANLARGQAQLVTALGGEGHLSKFSAPKASFTLTMATPAATKTAKTRPGTQAKKTQGAM